MPEVPKGAKQPSDRAKKEVKAEVEGGATIVWRGKKVTVLPRDEWPWDCGEFLANAQFVSWSRDALTKKSFEHVLAQRPTVRDFDELLAELMQALGEDLGESDRSSDS